VNSEEEEVMRSDPRGGSASDDRKPLVMVVEEEEGVSMVVEGEHVERHTDQAKGAWKIAEPRGSSIYCRMAPGRRPRSAVPRRAPAGLLKPLPPPVEVEVEVEEVVVVVVVVDPVAPL
jgi:hypothetical protein